MKPPGASIFALHGFAQTPTQWLDLLPDAECPWISGHGPEVPVVTDFDGEVTRLLERARLLSAPRVLVGYSQGARLGLGMLARDATLFERAMLVGLNPGVETDSARDERLKWEREVSSKLELEGLGAFWTYWDALPTLAKTRPDPGCPSEEARRSSLDARGLAWAITTLGLGAMPNFWAVLDNIQTETDLVVGELDSKFAPLAERAQRALRRSRLHKIPGAGHNPLFDAPEAMAALVNTLAKL